MDLLPVNEEPRKNKGLKALVVLYTMDSEKYNIMFGIKDVLAEELTRFLEKTSAKNTSSDLRILWSKDGEYDILCAVSARIEDEHTIRKAGAIAYRALKEYNVATMVLSDGFKPEIVAEGALLASFNYDYLKEKKTPRMVIVPERESQEFQKVTDIISAQNFCRFLSDTPANLMTPRLFTEYTKKYMKGLKNIEILEFDRAWVENRKMGLLLSVANGSEEDLRFLHVKYRGCDSQEVNLALVGKGVTFDSGGISLKPSAKMGDMKMDMTGAASIVSVIGVIAKLGKKINLDAIVPLCENMPSGRATKPGDVAKASNGKTVEIDNTDAEGRLILADALLYAQEFNPEYIVDVATLTGAMSVALGPVYSGFFTKDEDLATWMSKAGNVSGDLVWRMPLDKRYRPQLDSAVADMKNVGTRSGGSCTAAIFLKEFVGDAFKWAHIDIASTMCESVFSELYGKGATGSPVRMLVSLIEEIETRK